MDARARRRWCDLAYLVAAGVTVVAGGRHDRRTQLVAKPLLMPLLALGELSDADRRADRVDAGLLAVGLAAATAGDVHMIDVDDDAALRRGASCFAVMQVCWWLRAHRTGAVPGAAQVVPRAVAWSIASTVTARRLPTPAPVLIGYGALLGGAGAAADAVGGRTALGGRLFTVSDTTVLIRRMLGAAGAADPRSRTARLLEAFVLATYAGAQYLLVRPSLADDAPVAP
ncbi:lysoplasmalogenase family protein [Millisia brevis]|uniref:lysoplasmalogenase family protein n=1 Tax=Millisia brevis TaxID=264148 RepID=UPI00082DD4A6|nr:lysoplasmalogenase family protein [Millisia brevis]